MITLKKLLFLCGLFFGTNCSALELHNDTPFCLTIDRPIKQVEDGWSCKFMAYIPPGDFVEIFCDTFFLEFALFEPKNKESGKESLKVEFLVQLDESLKKIPKKLGVSLEVWLDEKESKYKIRSHFTRTKGKEHKLDDSIHDIPKDIAKGVMKQLSDFKNKE